MISLIYVSTALKLLSGQELLDILRVSRDANKKHDITGMLLYKGGNFMQILEGPDEQVRKLFENIQKDPRHKDIITLADEQIQTRQFSQWEMAFQNLDSPEIQDEPGYSQFLQDDLTADVYRQNPLQAYNMLLMFRDNLR